MRGAECYGYHFQEILAVAKEAKQVETLWKARWLHDLDNGLTDVVLHGYGSDVMAVVVEIADGSGLLAGSKTTTEQRENIRRSRPSLNGSWTTGGNHQNRAWRYGGQRYLAVSRSLGTAGEDCWMV